ncbi:MAG: RNA 2'-phosphotransferase [Caulobacterales bacterium]|nr:RNA 2'-phosphotransferase [Caulobacterales bacterium]
MKRHSKLLSLLLRHDPARAGLVLDSGGWVTIEALLAGLARLDAPLTRAQLAALVANNDKKRFTISEDGERIRAAQGHSVEVDLGLSPRCPPKTLFHGTATRFLAAIRAEGLKPGERRQVHLSADRDTAVQVGRRHGRPVVLRVAAEEMHRRGATFFLADNGVWLTDCVAPDYLSLPDEEADR